MRNAADEGQVKKATEQERLLRDQELSDIKNLLEHPFGRRFIWRLLEHARVFESIYEMNAKIHYNSGMQDFGHFIMAEVAAADQDKLFLMMVEAKKQEEKLNV